MGGGMFLGLLEALLLGLAGLLFAFGLEIVSRALVAVVPAEDPKRTGEQPTQGTTPRASQREGPRETIEGGSVHRKLLRQRRDNDSERYGRQYIGTLWLVSTTTGRVIARAS